MRPLDARPWRMVSSELLLPSGDVLTVLSCSHERLNVTDVEFRAPDRRVARCPYCFGGVDAIVPIEHVPA
jgi:hypothetical protein